MVWTNVIDSSKASAFVRNGVTGRVSEIVWSCLLVFVMVGAVVDDPGHPPNIEIVWATCLEMRLFEFRAKSHAKFVRGLIHVCIFIYLFSQSVNQLIHSFQSDSQLANLFIYLFIHSVSQTAN